MTELSNSTFVKPYPQPELDGKLGLTDEDIAKSLGVEPKVIREKFTRRGMLERLEENNMTARAYTRPNKTNGLPMHGYTVCRNGAKFIAGKHNSPLGDKYLAYLLHLENKIEEIEELAKTNPLLATSMVVTKIATEVAKQGERLNEQERKLAEVEDNQVESYQELMEVKSKVDQIKLRSKRLPANHPIPHEFMRTDEIYKRLFDGIGVKHISKILIESQLIPARVLIKRKDGSEFYTHLYRRSEVVLASDLYEETREFVKETAKCWKWDHEIIGPHRTLKATTRKPPLVYKQNLIDFGGKLSDQSEARS